MTHRPLQEFQAEALLAAPSFEIDEGQLLQTFLDNTPDHVYFKDLEGRFTRLSRSLARWLGLGDPVEALGLTDFHFFAEVHAASARAMELEVIRTGTAVVGREERQVWPDGRVSWVSTTRAPLCDRDRGLVGIFGTAQDITDRKVAEVRESEQAAELAELAAELSRVNLQDELTGLYNRRGFEQLGDTAIESAHRVGSSVCVLFADVDGLKAINDGFGHAAGDRALIDVATRLRTTLRSSDVVGRIGGDEFAAVVAGLSSLEVQELCDRVRDATRAHRPSEPPLSVSVGVATFRIGLAERLDELLAAADRAMYDGRHRRRTSYAV